MPYMGEVRHGDYRIKYNNMSVGGNRWHITILDTDSVVVRRFDLSNKDMAIRQAQQMIDDDFKYAECVSCGHVSRPGELRHSTTCKEPSETLVDRRKGQPD